MEIKQIAPGKWNISHARPAIPADVYDKLRTIIVDEHNYKPAKSIRAKYKLIAKKYDVELSQLLSVRNLILINHIGSRSSIIRTNIDKICEDYESRKSTIIDLSREYDFPPLKLLENIFNVARGSDETEQVFKCLKVELLSEYDKTQFYIAYMNDFQNNEERIIAQNTAQIAEEVFVLMLRRAGIKLQSERELIHKQTADYGRAIITPDILFIDKVYCEGKQIKWLDVKNYVGTKINIFYNSNKNQIKKYHKEYGYGAIYYTNGHVENLTFPGAIVV